MVCDATSKNSTSLRDRVEEKRAIAPFLKNNFGAIAAPIPEYIS